MFGDMTSNLRGALDHLVWQLVLANKAQPRRATSFPIVKREKDWDRAAAGALTGVADRWVRELRAVQPFTDGATNPADHPLAALDDVNNANKHRVISPYAMTGIQFAPEMKLNRPTRGNEHLEGSVSAGIDLVDGARLGRIRLVSPENDVFIRSVGPVDPRAITVAFKIDGQGSPSNSAAFGMVDRIFSLVQPAFDGQ